MPQIHSPIQQCLKVPGRRANFRLPNRTLSNISQWGPRGKRCPSPEPSITPLGSPNRAPKKDRCSISGAPLPLSHSVPCKQTPSLGSTMGTLGETSPQNILHPIPWKFIFPSESPVRELPPRSSTVCPETGILHHQSHWSIYSLIHVYLLKSPKRSLPKYREKHKVTVRGDPRRQKAYIQWSAAWFHKGFINDTTISTPVPWSPQHDTFHLGFGYTTAPLARACHSKPHQGIPSTTVTACHMTQGRVQTQDTPGYG